MATRNNLENEHIRIHQFVPLNFIFSYDNDSNFISLVITINKNYYTLFNYLLFTILKTKIQFIMNKLLILFFSLTFSFSVFSQDKLQDRAKKISDEMTTVLSLNDKDSEKIYIIQLKRFIDAKKIRNIHKGDKELMKTELKKMQGKLWQNLKGVVGKDNMKLWGMYKKTINKKNK